MNILKRKIILIQFCNPKMDRQFLIIPSIYEKTFLLTEYLNMLNYSCKLTYMIKTMY